MKLIELDDAVLRERYDRQPFTVRHALSAHPVFDPSELRALALRLPRPSVLHRHGEVPLDADFDDAWVQHANGLSLEETFDRLQEVNGYIVLQHPERDPAFRTLADEVIAELRALDPGLNWFETRVFIAAGGSVSPFHVSRDLGFTLQLRGQQTISLWDPNDREVSSELERERLLTDAAAARPPWRDELFLTENRIELAAGDGVHQAFLAPRLVRTLDQPSLSWSIRFRTDRTDSLSAVHEVNHLLRRFGVQPTPHGISKVIDFAKAAAGRAVKTLEVSPRFRRSA